MTPEEKKHVAAAQAVSKLTNTIQGGKFDGWHSWNGKWVGRFGDGVYVWIDGDSYGSFPPAP